MRHNLAIFFSNIQCKVFTDNEQLISLHVGDSIKVYARENMEGAYPMEDFSRIEEN